MDPLEKGSPSKKSEPLTMKITADNTLISLWEEDKLISLSHMVNESPLKKIRAMMGS